VTKAALITGVTGFIGGKLALRLIEEGWAVHAVVRPTSAESRLPVGVVPHPHDGSVAGLTAIVRAAKPDVVFHLASLYLADHRPDQVDALVQSNILFPAQLVEAMLANDVRRLLNTGTGWQHYRAIGYDPVNLYAATKQACADLLRFYQDAHGLSVVTLKIFDTYGTSDTRRKLVQLLVDAALSGDTLGMSAGDQIIDLTHVDDVVGAFVIAANRLLASDVALDEEFFVSGERLRLRELVAQVGTILDRPVDAEFGARPYRAREVMRPVEPPATLPGWQPRITLREGVATLATLG